MTKGKKNEPRKIDRWDRDDLTFLDNRTKDLSFSSPYDLERGLEHPTEFLKRSQTEPGLTLLEFILREFEDEAKKILEENDLNSEELIERWRTFYDIEDFSRLCLQLEYDSPSLLEPSHTSMQLQMAAHVAFCVDRLRSDISNGDAEQTAIDMLKLCFAAVNVNLHEIIIRGIRAKTGPAKGGRVKKKLQGIILATRWALKNSRNKGALSLWRHLIRELKYGEKTFGEFDIGFDENKNCLFQIDRNGKDKEIRFRAFQNYVRDLKK
jgi:hypothetical protein